VTDGRIRKTYASTITMPITQATSRPLAVRHSSTMSSSASTPIPSTRNPVIRFDVDRYRSVSDDFDFTSTK
jgi:hypothetical protein